MKPIEILPTGSITSTSGSRFNFSEADLQQIAHSFSGRVPFVPGHPTDDQPQLGYATEVAVQDGRLLVTAAEDVDPTFAAIVNSGELPGVSVKLLMPDHPDNSTDGLLLRHIGFLGRSQPAAQGLQAPTFQAQEAESHTVEFATKFATEQQPRGAHSSPLSSSDSETETEGTPMTDTPTTPDQSAEFAQREADLAQKEAELAERTATFARAQAITPFLDGLVAEGRLLPVHKPGFVALFSTLPEEQTVEFAQGDETVKQPTTDFLKTFLKGLPQQVQFGEVARSEGTAEFAQGDQSADPTEQVRTALNQRYAQARKA